MSIRTGRASTGARTTRSALVGLIGSVALIGSLSAGAGLTDPGVTLDPTSGDRESVVALEGNCLIDGSPVGDTARVEFRWADGDEFFRWWETFPVGEGAAWSGETQVPDSAQSGVYEVVVTCQNGDEEGVHRASAEFTVSGPALDPPELTVDPQPVEAGASLEVSASCGPDSADAESVLVLSDGDELDDEQRWWADWSGERPDDPGPLFQTTFVPDGSGAWEGEITIDSELAPGTYRLAIYCNSSSQQSTGRDIPLEVSAAAVPEPDPTSTVPAAAPPAPVPASPTFTG